MKKLIFSLFYLTLLWGSCPDAALAGIGEPNTEGASLSAASQGNYKENFSEGDPQAPVNIMIYYDPVSEYSIKMWREIREPLLRNYVQKGLVRLTYQEMIHKKSHQNHWAILMARCVPKDKYVPLIDALVIVMEDINKAKTQRDRLPFLQSVAATNGINWPDVYSCMSNPATLKFVTDQRDLYDDNYDIIRMPSLLIMGTNFRFTRFSSFSNIDRALQLILAARQPAQ